MQVPFLGQEDPLEEGMSTHSNTFVWKIAWIEKPGRLHSIESHRVGQDWSDLAAAAEYIMWNAGLEEAQAGIKISGRNINNLRYTDDTTLMAESEEPKILLMNVKEESEKLA